ncbi:hypothetical protein PPACK8108_LOCUS5180 [Phakopsora pachyrhizi]|uniref:Uncharacterized protein n=1 Tax=Phakopsora pachyrhizi TaxID=170000 RepID=A0AAV0AQC7_PHAPC|nr:hypothetical protein PPACK8108_LOCUS5180 [Phakopsora pachyrhizi]
MFQAFHRLAQMWLLFVPHSHLSPPKAFHKVPFVPSSQKSLAKEDSRNDSESGYNSFNGQSSSSHLSHTTEKSLGINVNCINPGVEIDKLKSQLAIAFSEDKGLRKCSNFSTTSINHVTGANMIDLSPHGIKGPEGLVPFQKRI